jgi:predicted transcriptional regulator
MPKEALFTMKLESELREAFMAEAKAANRPASQIMRELMRRYVARQRKKREYEAYYRSAVEAGLADIKAGRVYSSQEVEAHFAELRAKLLKDMEGE